MSIYTRTGDDGTTARLDGSRVAKDDAIMEALGAIDELGSHVGLCAHAAGHEMQDLVEPLQQILAELLTLGGIIAAAGTQLQAKARPIAAEAVVRIETLTDQAIQTAGAATSFILPGGTALACNLHIARTVCRRAERRVVTLVNTGLTIEPVAMQYLNRLGDMLFAYARLANYEAGLGND